MKVKLFVQLLKECEITEEEMNILINYSNTDNPNIREKVDEILQSRFPGEEIFVKGRDLECLAGDHKMKFEYPGFENIISPDPNAELD